MKCSNPSCGSDNTRRLSMMYAEGSGTVTGISSTYGVVDLGNRLGSVSTSTTSTERYESDLARRYAPPQKPAFSWFIFLVPVVLLAGGAFAAPHVIDEFSKGAASRYLGDGDSTAFKVYFAMLVVALLVGIYLGGRSALRRFNVEDAAYQQAEAKWSRSWLCLKCGQVYESESPNRQVIGSGAA